ncbi:hypothetical protein EYF80_012593 [Liparis tanakae]|uniref:Uncharacterized protein n=1 Tax=Liparis tanakae TaxID=230148 RepID=A0A4Z2II50_9TELE|nr:hypothetical protein EYF80_012593 [Liparis tanakae]
MVSTRQISVSGIQRGAETSRLVVLLLSVLVQEVNHLDRTQNQTFVRPVLGFPRALGSFRRRALLLGGARQA